MAYSKSKSQYRPPEGKVPSSTNRQVCWRMHVQSPIHFNVYDGPIDLKSPRGFFPPRLHTKAKWIPISRSLHDLSPVNLLIRCLRAVSCDRTLLPTLAYKNISRRDRIAHSSVSLVKAGCESIISHIVIAASSRSLLMATKCAAQVSHGSGLTWGWLEAGSVVPYRNVLLSGSSAVIPSPRQIGQSFHALVIGFSP